jgi:hypothetical protein
MQRFQVTSSVKRSQNEFIGTAGPDPQEFLKKDLDSRFRASMRKGAYHRYNAYASQPAAALAQSRTPARGYGHAAPDRTRSTIR